jgi:hypothetical protein
MNLLFYYKAKEVRSVAFLLRILDLVKENNSILCNNLVPAFRWHSIVPRCNTESFC